MEKYSTGCGRGYLQIATKLLPEIDRAFKENNVSTLLLLLKVCMDLIKKILPTIRNKGLRAALVQVMELNEQGQKTLKKGELDFNLLNKIFSNAASSLKKASTPTKPKPKPTPKPSSESECGCESDSDS